MTDLYPLIFRPIPREKDFWGGSRLVTLLGKPFPADAKVGESWDLSDYPGLESIVDNGPLAGTSLHQLVERRAPDLVGDTAILQAGRFPLLIKYIDAAQTLSVQVHPDDDYAGRHEKGHGKKEAWYIIHADPGAKLIYGVTPGTTREKFQKALKKGQLDPCLRAVEPRPGDMFLIPWGTVHAIGAGVVLAEIQQASDLTYRVYDWSREDGNGESRQLQIERALDVIKFEAPHRDTCERRLLVDGPSRRYEGTRCGKFVVEIIELRGDLTDSPPPGRFVILNVVRGSARLVSAGREITLHLGATVLIPAALPPYALKGDDATILRSYVP